MEEILIPLDESITLVALTGNVNVEEEPAPTLVCTTSLCLPGRKAREHQGFTVLVTSQMGLTDSKNLKCDFFSEGGEFPLLTSSWYLSRSCCAAHVASMSSPLMLTEPTERVVVTTGSGMGVWGRVLSLFLSFLVNCCLCFTGL